MIGFLAQFGKRNLVGAPGAFNRLAVDFLRARPAFGCAHDQHRPCRAVRRSALTRSLLDSRDAIEDFVEYCGGLLMHRCRIVAFECEGLVSVAAHQIFKFRMRNARQYRRIGDLVAVQVQNGQHCAICRGIDELVGVPARRQWSGFRFAVTHDAGDDQVGIVEGRAVGMDERVAKFAAFVNRARCLRRDVAWNAIGPAELPEQTLDAVAILLDVRIHLGVGALEIGVRDKPGAAVSGADDIDHVEVTLANQAVPMDVQKIESGGRSPVAEKAWLDIVQC